MASLREVNLNTGDRFERSQFDVCGQSERVWLVLVPMAGSTQSGTSTGHARSTSSQALALTSHAVQAGITSQAVALTTQAGSTRHAATLSAMQAADLRKAFSTFFAERDHQVRPSASLIPHEPSLLFTVAGMVPFMPYFLGEETPPHKRLTTIQKCVRAGGKHNDLDDIGRTNRHFTFFEMMGNFSFGDYFKSEAIAFAWEFVTEVLELPAESLWATVHLEDDEAAEIWRTEIGIPPERIQRMGEDNWWAAGDKGPCGPCSEIYYDLGPEFGPEGGPAGGGEDRYVELWNLVFIQFANDGTGTLNELAAPGIDTGAGLERLLAIKQGVSTVWDTDLFEPLLAQAQAITGTTYGQDSETDVSLRILADHARAATMLINDGVFPSNEERGYVLRRIIRRAVRHAWVLGVSETMMPRLTDTVIGVMGDAYPDLIENRQFISDVVAREEERFRSALVNGSTILDNAVSALGKGEPLSGEIAFQLHDTFGFPVELTREVLTERGLVLDDEGYEQAMNQQRERARAVVRNDAPTFADQRYRELVEQFGLTDFVRDATAVDDAHVIAVMQLEADNQVEVFLNKTPFYAESGGQIGDIGTITVASPTSASPVSTSTGSASTGPPIILEVLDCTYALVGLHRHVCRVPDGVGSDQLPSVGAVARVEINAERRNAIRRNHTGTHILHWALREVLGDHVKQAGSLVAPDRLRFDYSHYEAPTADQLREIEDLANAEIIANGRCHHFETTMSHAQQLGAIAFFGDKYGDIVRVLEAGPNSIELCGGTHVAALGDIGHLRIVADSSIGSNLRRIEAITGTATVQRLQATESILGQLAELLRCPVNDVVDALSQRLDETKQLRREIRSLQPGASPNAVAELVARAEEGVVVADMGDLERDALRDLAVSVRDSDGIQAAVLASAPSTGGVALVAAVDPAGQLTAADLLEDAAKSVQGGFARKGNPHVIVAGGKNSDGIAEALQQARHAAGLATSPA